MKSLRDHYIDYDGKLEEWTQERNNEALLVADMFREAADTWHNGLADLSRDKLNAALSRAEEACFLADELIDSLPQDPDKAWADEQGD